MLNKHQIQPESDPINYADQREDGELKEEAWGFYNPGPL